MAELPKKILLKGTGRFEEADAVAALTPGHLLEVDSAGEVKKHATEGGRSERAFALEDALQGNTVDDAYADGDKVFYVLAYPGAEVFAFIKAGQNVAIGDNLISNGDGTLIKGGNESTGVTVNQVIGEAMEVMDLSGSGATDTRAAVRVL